NRSQYAAFITILLTILVLTVSSVLVLQFESNDPASSIKTGGDALWYSIVTITTVGYGDFYPVTAAGRVAGMFIMFAGVGIIGALASLLSSLLVGGGSAPEEEETPAGTSAGNAEQELVALNQKLSRIEDELAALHTLLAKTPGDD
ncbi:MAG: potassium channel family protein, partial [Bacteroidota bacterium]